MGFVGKRCKNATEALVWVGTEGCGGGGVGTRRAATEPVAVDEGATPGRQVRPGQLRTW
jgi:hypothetical protein